MFFVYNCLVRKPPFWPFLKKDIKYLNKFDLDFFFLCKRKVSAIFKTIGIHLDTAIF